LTNLWSSKQLSALRGLETEERGEDRSTTRKGCNKDNDFDNWNVGQRNEEKKILYPSRPDVCVSDWLERFGYHSNPFCFLSHFFLCPWFYIHLIYLFFSYLLRSNRSLLRDNILNSPTSSLICRLKDAIISWYLFLSSRSIWRINVK